MLKEIRYLDGNNTVSHRKFIDRKNSTEIGIYYYSTNESEQVDRWVFHRFNNEGKLVITTEMSGGVLEKTEFKRGPQGKLITRLVTEGDKLISRFEYEYRPGQKAWWKKTEFNGAGDYVDMKAQEFDDEGRLTLFTAHDAEIGPVERKEFLFNGDSIIYESVYLNLDKKNYLNRVDSVVMYFREGLPTKEVSFGSQEKLIDTKIWGYDDSLRVTLKTKIGSNGDTLKRDIFMYPFPNRVIQISFDKKGLLSKHIETDTDTQGNLVYECIESNSKRVIYHRKFDIFGNPTLISKHIIDQQEDIDSEQLEVRNISYYVD
jgi:hypothetical protein